jgi:hypothetical protein
MNAMNKLKTLIAAAILCWSLPAAAVELLTIPITTAVTAQVSPTFQLRGGPGAGVVPGTWTTGNLRIDAFSNGLVPFP